MAEKRTIEIEPKDLKYLEDKLSKKLKMMGIKIYAKTIRRNKSFDNPTEKVSDYLPHQTCDSGTFEPVGQSIDEKPVNIYDS